MEVLYHQAQFGGNRTTHVGVRGQSLMFFTFRHAFAGGVFGYRYVVKLAQQEIASVFEGRFRRGWQRFQGKNAIQFTILHKTPNATILFRFTIFHFITVFFNPAPGCNTK